MASFGRAGMLEPLAAHLRAHGFDATAPSVPPYTTLAERGAVWADHLNALLERTGAERVHLIGFSAGGLDARRLAHHGFGERIASITTVSTPHHGSPLASWVLERPAPVRAVPISVMHVLGRLVYPTAPPRVRAALAELTPEAVEGRFNPRHPDVPGIVYESWGAAAGTGTGAPLTPTLWLHHRILNAATGLNDGFVPVDSARWGTFRGVVPADHLRIIRPRPSRSFDAPAFFLDRARELARRDSDA